MHRRSRLWLYLLLVAFFLGSILVPPVHATEKQNDCPIVLVHGFTGWGRDEMAGYLYWGGLGDIEADLNRHGYKTFTAAVGPFSSNWDRACELYAFIKGGTVDYGAAHAAKYGHARFGRTYPGIYPQWGEADPVTGKVNKIHLVGHSMGGQTIRMLIQLLENGSPEEMAATSPDQISPLFTRGKRWVLSATSVSTPHDGTTLADIVTGLIPCAQQIISMAAAAAGLGSEPIYDFKMDQWGLKRLPGESFASYANRVLSSPVWEDTKDISVWDLCPDGAKELNSWVKAAPDVYYFSIGTECTHKGLLTGHQEPNITMNPLFHLFAHQMGSYTRNDPYKVPIDRSWWKNDGVVNTVSMDGPKLGSSDTVKSYDGTPTPGVWQHLGTASNLDHMQIIGHYNVLPVYDRFRSLAALLSSLPN